MFSKGKDEVGVDPLFLMKWQHRQQLEKKTLPMLSSNLQVIIHLHGKIVMNVDGHLEVTPSVVPLGVASANMTGIDACKDQR